MRFVRGEGPVPCDLMFIGEGPGKEEEAYGRPFVGKAGRELERYLWQSCHRNRSSVYITNLVKFRVPGDQDPSSLDVERDRHILEEEISSVNPTFIAALGRHSTRYLLGDVDMDVVHGIPHLARLLYCVVPILHPAAGLHNTESQGVIAWDFQKLAMVMKGEIGVEPPEDQYPDPDYVEVERYFNLEPTAVDTEGSIKKPWCLTATSHEGAATCVRAGGQAFFKHIILHNSMHDIGVLRAMMSTYDSFDDTMLMAYNLCIEPQGLKQLAKRHCGMDMQSYQELVDPARIKKQTDWLQKAFTWLNNRSIEESEARSTGSGSKGPTRKRVGKKSKKASRKTAA